MIRRFFLVIWFISIIAVAPLSVASFFFECLVEPFFWVAAFAVSPLFMSMIEYIFTGDTKKTKQLLRKRS